MALTMRDKWLTHFLKLWEVVGIVFLASIPILVNTWLNSDYIIETIIFVIMLTFSYWKKEVNQ
jgi:hypothetical protein